MKILAQFKHDFSKFCKFFNNNSLFLCFTSGIDLIFVYEYIQYCILIIHLCWDTSTSCQVSNCDGVVLKICLDHKFPVTTGGFELRISCIQSSYLTHYAIRPNRLGGFGVPEFATLRQ